MAHKFKTLVLHAGINTDETGSRGFPIHRTASYLFKDTKHAANLFALKELGNIYTRIQNPTQDVLEQRVAALENDAAALALASGTAAIGGIVVDSGKFDWTDQRFKLYNEPDPSYHDLRYAHDLGGLPLPLFCA